MTDLTGLVTSIPFNDPNEWTPENLAGWLREHNLPATFREGKHHFPACPSCGESEGHAAVWLYDGIPVAKCFRATCGLSFADLVAKFAPKQHLPVLALADLPAKYPRPREPIVEGLIRRGDVCNIIGGPKTRKSFLVLLLAICVAAGLPFLGWPTRRGKVLLCDNEMRPDDLGRRALAVANALGISLPGNVEVMPLRGHLASVDTIRAELARRQQRYALVICDALYKLLPEGTDENSNSDIAKVYVTLDALAEEQDSACVVVHHASKGQQHTKAVSDCGAGAGAQSRSADCHLVLREHESANTVVLSAVLRSQPPFDPLAIRFDYPIWKVSDANPENLAVVNKKPGATLDQFLATIPLEPAPKNDVLAATQTTLRISKTSVKALLHRATEDGLVTITTPKNPTHPHRISRAKA